MKMHHRVVGVLGVAGAVIAVGGASRFVSAAPSAPVRGTPAPAFHSRIETVSRSEVMRYANGLTFDTSYHAIDSRKLFDRRGGKNVEGAFATIAPEVGSTTISWSQLDSGRIMARVTTDAPMPSRGYGKGDNYIWVENRNGHLHGVIIPADSSVAETPFRVAIVHKNIGAARAPQARFRWNQVVGDDVVWFDCALGCCTADPPNGSPFPSSPSGPPHGY